MRLHARTCFGVNGLMRKLILKLHLYLGLASAVLLIVLGLTGSVIAFEGDIEHWLHSDLWYVKAGTAAMPEADLIKAAEQRFAPARVRSVQFFRQRNLVQLMQMSDGALVYVNPYDGSMLGRTRGASNSQRVLGSIHQVHLRLTPDPRSTPIVAAAGKVVVSWAGLALCLLVPTGLVLWWRKRRASVRLKGSWFRICFDAHQATGIYAGLFLFLAAFTGILIGFDFGEQAIFAVTHSSRPGPRLKMSSTPGDGAAAIGVDGAMEIARRSIPEATVAGILLPLEATAVYTVLMRVPEETSESVHSSVALDRYSGKVLEVRNFMTDSLGYRAIRFNRSVHTGDIWGMPSRIVASLSSLLLVVMAVTGLVIWWKKLAV
jgi:uncharacterized iron-regulated membrane protein